jgi:hypothetical protein
MDLCSEMTEKLIPCFVMHMDVRLVCGYLQ